MQPAHDSRLLGHLKICLIATSVKISPPLKALCMGLLTHTHTPLFICYSYGFRTSANYFVHIIIVILISIHLRVTFVSCSKVETVGTEDAYIASKSLASFKEMIRETFWACRNISFYV